MALDRYLKDEGGFRKYVELMEGMSSAKRKALMDAAKAENRVFVETAEQFIITFDRITKLPDMELTEVLGAAELKPEVIAVAIASVMDAGVREKLLKFIPRKLMPAITQELKENPEPKPYDIGASRLKLICAARELEKKGMLKSVLIPRFEKGFFEAKAA